MSKNLSESRKAWTTMSSMKMMNYDSFSSYFNSEIEQELYYLLKSINLNNTDNSLLQMIILYCSYATNMCLN